MVTVAEVKEYLRIPYDEEDVFVQSIIEAGYDYLQDAVDDFDKLYQSNERFARKADYFVKLHWSPTAYDQREGMLSGEPALNYAARALLTQLQLYTYSEGGEQG